jgi:hypothetical protein
MLRKFLKMVLMALLLPALVACANKGLITPQITHNLVKVTLIPKEKKEFLPESRSEFDVEFSIKNMSNSNIKVNLEYIQAAGLWLALKDIKNGACADAWPNLPIGKKFKPLTTLHSGEKITIKNTVQDDRFQGMKCQQKHIDLDLEIGTGSPIQANDPSIYVILNDVTPVSNTEKLPTSN